ncbi:MAG: HlyC/CorC family transporter [Phycisphaerae bacterium]|nr:HlyC/CorC family transporter [Phycisphaerae bacterium]
MPDSELFIGLGLAVLATLSTTANVALRHFSRVQLDERLERTGRASLLDRLTERRDDLIFSTSVVRICSILGLVLLIAHAFGFGPSAHAQAGYITVFTLSVLVVLVLGVALPHAWARYAGDGYLAAILPALLLLRTLLFPFLAIQHLFNGLVRRLAGVPLADEEEAEADQIEQQILGAVSEGELAGAVHEEDAEMIQSVMGLRDKHVAQIMTPRTEMVALPASITLDEAKEFIAREGHSRIPIYGDSLDDVRGVLYAKDLLMFTDRDEFEPLEAMRKVPFVPETKRIPDLLTELREKKVHLAIVVDEYGGTAGLVTIEDIIEEIVGDIADEYENPAPESIRHIDDKTVEVDARVHIDELNHELGIELPEDRDYDTVGGFLFSEMGKIPAAGEELSFRNIRFSVLDAEERKINRLRIQVVPDEPAH